MNKLNEPVLILNKNWFAIGIRTVKKAILLASRDRAFFIDECTYETYSWDEWINLPIPDGRYGIITIKKDIRIPEVVILIEYKKIPTTSPRLTKRNIFTRDRHICQYTNKKVSFKNADIDHIVPVSKGGKHSWDNMVVCSKEINRLKADKTPEEAGLRLIRKPYKPSIIGLMIDPRIEIKDSWRKFIHER